MKQKKVLDRILEEDDIKINLVLLDDEKAKKKYNIKNFPGIVVNGCVVSQGKVLTERELKKNISIKGLI